AKAAIACTSIQPRRLRLHPVKKGETQLPRGAFVGRSLLRGYADQRPEPVVVLRPVHESDVATVAIGRIVSAIEDPAERPQIFSAFRLEDGLMADVEGDRIDKRPAKLLCRPERRAIAAPEIIVRRPLDGVILAGEIVDGEAGRDRLLVER